MKSIAALGLGLLGAGLLSCAAQAATLSQKQALSMCKARYGTGITSVTIQKNGHVICREGPGPDATRSEVFDYCKKKYSATTLIIRKKPSGQWECRYYGRY